MRWLATLIESPTVAPRPRFGPTVPSASSQLGLNPDACELRCSVDSCELPASVCRGIDDGSARLPLSYPRKSRLLPFCPLMLWNDAWELSATPTRPLNVN